jgi:hypothetical protein
MEDVDTLKSIIIKLSARIADLEAKLELREQQLLERVDFIEQHHCSSLDLVPQRFCFDVTRTGLLSCASTEFAPDDDCDV